MSLAALRRRPLPWLFAALCLLKFALALGVEPLEFPDSLPYRQYAGMMRGSSAWLHDAGFGGAWLSPRAFRMPGYPAVLAAAEAAAGVNGTKLLILLQTALSLTASWLAFRCAERLTRSFAVAALAAVGYSAAGLCWDLSLLPDSLYGSLFCALLSLLALRAGNAAAPFPGFAFAFGSASAASCLLRESGFAFVPIFAFIFAWGAGPASARRRSLALAAFLTPSLLLYLGLRAWNEHRSGRAFLTTGSQTALLQPLVRLGRFGANPFDGDTPLDRAARELVREHVWAEVLPINVKLAEAFGLTPYEIKSAVEARYLASLARHPSAFLRLAGEEMVRMAPRVFNPALNLRLALGPAPGSEQEGGRRGLLRRLARLRADFSPLEAVELAAVLAEGLFSCGAFLFGALLYPVLRLGGRMEPSRAGLKGLDGLWVAAAAMAGAFAFVHWEQRYTIGAAPALLVLAGVSWTTTRRLLLDSAPKPNPEAESAS